jgi:hypothetical protein
MNNKEFVEVIKVVTEQCAQATIGSLLVVPGRKPDSAKLALAQWYNSLGDIEKDNVNKIIKEATAQATFSFLCVLDGVTAIEDGESKGALELTYIASDGSRLLLNNPENEYLHDVFNS